MITLKRLSVRKLQILGEAQKLIAQRGYKATSMRDLARVLMIEPASLYSHFRSKEAILWEIAIRCANTFHEGIAPIVASDLAAPEKLERMIRRHLHLIIEQIDASAIFFHEWEHLSNERQERYIQLRNEYEGYFRAVLLEGIKEGTIREVEVRFTTRTLLSGVNWVHRWFRPDGRMTEEGIADQLVKLLLHGLLQSNQTA